MNNIINASKYNLVDLFDNLYNNSKNGDNAISLFKHVISEDNVRLAMENIRQFQDIDVKDTNGNVFADLLNLDFYEVFNQMLNRLSHYVPEPIFKYKKSDFCYSDFKIIPTVYDRLIQQCIFQVLEPYVEPKFYNHSYGHRPLRSESHALSKIVSLINRGKCYYAVSFDLTDFFSMDSKLFIERLWSFGVHDKKLISVIKAMFCFDNNHFDGSGLLCDIFTNIYLTDLDRWIESQWEHFPCNGNIHSFHNKEKIDLKHGYIVRFGKRFVILTKKYNYACRWKLSVIDYLNKRLHISIPDDCCQIVNLKQKYFNFLGFKIKAVEKGNARNGFVAESHVSDASLKHIQRLLHKAISDIQHNPKSGLYVFTYNNLVIRIKDYYKFATMVYLDFDKIGKGINLSMKIRLGNKCKIINYCDTTKSYKKYNVGLQKFTKIYSVNNNCLHVINAVHHKYPMNYKHDLSIYGKQGRKLAKISID